MHTYPLFCLKTYNSYVTNIENNGLFVTLTTQGVWVLNSKSSVAKCTFFQPEVAEAGNGDQHCLKKIMAAGQRGPIFMKMNREPVTCEYTRETKVPVFSYFSATGII